MDLNVMLVHSCGAMVVGAVKYTVKHSMSALGCLPRKKPERTIVWYYKGTLFYQNMCTRGIMMIEYMGTGSCMWVWKTFKLLLWISERMKHYDGNQHNAWIVFTAFNLFPYIDDSRHLRGEVTKRFVGQAESRTANVEFLQNVSPASFCDLNWGDIMVVNMLRKISSAKSCLFHIALLIYFLQCNVCQEIEC